MIHITIISKQNNNKILLKLIPKLNFVIICDCSAVCTSKNYMNGK